MKGEQKKMKKNEIIMYRDWEIEVFGNNHKVYRVWKDDKCRDFYEQIEAETYIDYLVDTFFKEKNEGRTI